MSLGERAIAALGAGRGGGVTLEEEGLRVRFRAEAADQVGCAVVGLRVEDLRAGARDADALKAWAGRVAGRVTYLIEEIAVVETDAAGESALLRSASPDRRGEARAYYEVVLRRSGVLTLTRYRYQNGDRERTEIPCLLTLEVFERLVDDLAETMRG
jgi:hypothetical protein